MPSPWQEARRARLQRQRNIGERNEESCARPGCIIHRGRVALVVDEQAETWAVAPICNCQRCGLDQHLSVCLDCLSQ